MIKMMKSKRIRRLMKYVAKEFSSILVCLNVLLLHVACSRLVVDPVDSHQKYSALEQCGVYPPVRRS